MFEGSRIAMTCNIEYRLADDLDADDNELTMMTRTRTQGCRVVKMPNAFEFWNHTVCQVM